MENQLAQANAQLKSAASAQQAAAAVASASADTTAVQAQLRTALAQKEALQQARWGCTPRPAWPLVCVLTATAQALQVHEADAARHAAELAAWQRRLEQADAQMAEAHVRACLHLLR
jgi:hypothetical protein